MIPKHSSRLSIGVVVVLVLPGHDKVLCPSIKGSTRWRSVEMDGAFTVAMIDESHNSLDTTRYHDGRSWRSAIVTNKTSWCLPGIDLLGVRLDVQLVIPNLLVGHRVDHLPLTMSVSYQHAIPEPTYCLTWAIGGIGSCAEYRVYAGLESPPFRAAGAFAGSSSTILDSATVSDCRTSLAKRLGAGLFWASADTESKRARVACVKKDNILKTAMLKAWKIVR
jgi:hypothetical protein